MKARALFKFVRTASFLALPGLATGQAGTLDSTFGVDGRVSTELAGLAESMDAALQADGKVIVVGRCSGSAFVVRYDTNGALDPGFGVDGVAWPEVLTGFTSFVGGAFAVAIDNVGGILTLHLAYGPSNGTDEWAVAVLRLHPDGTPDTNFGSNGIATSPTLISGLGGDLYGSALELDASGRIFAAGVRYVDGEQDAFLACFEANGIPSGSFGSGGVTIVSFGGFDWCRDIAVQADGSIVLAGSSEIEGSNVVAAVARCNGDGQLDESFGNGGKATIEHAGVGLAIAAVDIDTSGRLVLGGEFWSATFDDFGLMRILSDGHLDETFGSGGLVLTDFSGSEEGLESLEVDANGGVIAVGWAEMGATGSDFALARYDASGVLDPAFGTQGRATTDFGGTAGEWPSCMVIDHFGRPIVVGTVRDSSLATSDIAMARYEGVDTPPLLIEWLVEVVIDDLVESQLVSNGEGNALESKLQASIQQIDKGNEGPAIHQLEAFIHQLEGMVGGGALTTDQAQPLIDLAFDIVALITT